MYKSWQSLLRYVGFKRVCFFLLADGSSADVMSGDDKNQTDVEPDKKKPGSKADPPKLVPVSQKLSESSESTHKGI